MPSFYESLGGFDALLAACRRWHQLCLSPTFEHGLNAGHGDHHELDERCLALFEQALTDACLPPEPAARLAAHLRRATEAQRAYAKSKGHVPSDLTLPDWK